MMHRACTRVQMCLSNLITSNRSKLMCDEVFFDVNLSYLMSKSAGKLISHYVEALYKFAIFYSVSIHSTCVFIHAVPSHSVSLVEHSPERDSYRKITHNILFVSVANQNDINGFFSDCFFHQKSFTLATSRVQVLKALYILGALNFVLGAFCTIF